MLLTTVETIRSMISTEVTKREEGPKRNKDNEARIDRIGGMAPDQTDGHSPPPPPPPPPRPPLRCRRGPCPPLLLLSGGTRFHPFTHTHATLRLRSDFLPDSSPNRRVYSLRSLPVVRADADPLRKSAHAQAEVLAPPTQTCTPPTRAPEVYLRLKNHVTPLFFFKQNC